MPDSQKTALVTGGARGNGLAIARSLLHTGATVYLADIAADLPAISPPICRASPILLPARTIYSRRRPPCGKSPPMFMPCAATCAAKASHFPSGEKVALFAPSVPGISLLPSSFKRRT